MNLPIDNTRLLALLAVAAGLLAYALVAVQPAQAGGTPGVPSSDDCFVLGFGGLCGGGSAPGGGNVGAGIAIADHQAPPPPPPPAPKQRVCYYEPVATTKVTRAPVSNGDGTVSVVITVTTVFVSVQKCSWQ